ncbi:MAG: Cna B-type domain-containing protein [Lachnospiraceae bacterium]|nr:Cna B-type domain-containing protein [Lachnospiraceae bacterium]
MRRILSGVLCAAVLAASAAPKSVSVAESGLLSNVSAESAAETGTGDTEDQSTGTGCADSSEAGTDTSTDGSALNESAVSTGADVTGTDGMGTDAADISDANADASGTDCAGTDASDAGSSGTAATGSAVSDAADANGTGAENTETGGMNTDGTDTVAEESDGAGEETNTSAETEAELQTGILLASSAESDSENGEGDLNVNKSYVSALAVKSITDGTAPFDEDDDAGNDSASDNRIVRSFDYVNYTLEYTTALMDTTETVDEAYLMAEFTLACDPSVAEFNTDTLNWCLDQVITYVYADGTSSTKWNSKKTVTEQVFTGKRYLSKNEDANAIPGAGTLSVGIYVKAAVNGDWIQPAFTVWMEGNEARFFQGVQADPVRVSAAPRYNLNLVRNTYCNYLAYFDTESGTISGTDVEGSVYGRLEGYALTLQLYNTSADKGLKGIELPTGDITFDLTFTETLDGTDVSTQEDYTPILWDYRENESASLATVGKLGRTMAVGGQVSSAFGIRCQPYNSGGSSSRKACYAGGSWSISQDTESSGIYHVTVSGYAFDLVNLRFPTMYCESTTENVYGANIGCFSAGYIQVVVSFARSVETTSNLYFMAEAEHFAASSVSGQSTSSDQKSEDNTSGMNVTLYPEGSISKRNFFYTTDSEIRVSVWTAGDFYASAGEQLLVESVVDYSGDGCLTAVNVLQKIDDQAFAIPAGTTSYDSFELRNEQSDAGTIRVLFATKPDKTGWQSEAEMNAAHEEALIYFESIDALNAAGYTCVGFLYEIRDCALYTGSAVMSAILLNMPVEVKESAEIGSVYETMNDVRAWSSTADVVSWTEYSCGGGAYGLGDPNWSTGTYADGYRKPDYALYVNYGKTVYENGSVAAGHTGGYRAGNSCLIIGCKTGVSIQVADVTTTTAGVTTSKSIYDLDIGERTVTYTIHPTVSVVSENSEVSSSTETTDVTVWVTLPKELTYIMDSASLAPSLVTENEDGTSTVTWELPSRTVGEAIEDITISCLIGAAGTADDVQNNDSISISASITSDKDNRLITGTFGNYSETAISVIRLASTSISKGVERSIVEEGEVLTYILRYGNSAEEEASGVTLYDILPYDRDPRGSDFGGEYVVERIVLDFSNATKTFAEGKNDIQVRTTAEAGARDETAVEAILNGSDSFSWTEINGGDYSESALIFDGLSIGGASGLKFELGTVKAQEYVKITVTLAVKDSAGALRKDSSGEVQMPGDLYANSFYEYADGQVALVESNTVKIQVAERNISGLAWLDADGDGIREDAEARLEGISVSLYRTSVSGYAADAETAVSVNNIPLYAAYDVFGNALKTVLTDAEGSYRFPNLEAGTYYVVFTGTEAYGLTLLNSGNDDTVDSDAIGTLAGEELLLENAWIGELSLPALEEMYAYLCESGNHDAGFVAYTQITVNKLWVDEENRDGYRADFLRVTLSGSDGSDYVADLTEENGWSKTFTRLPVYDEQGEAIVYTVKEDPTAYYEAELTSSEDGSVFTFTNTHEIFTTECTVVKNWDDAEDQDGLRPASVEILLTGTDGSSYTAELTAEENWTYTFVNLPCYMNGGEEILYTLSETTIDGYTSSVEETEDGFLLTNQHTPEPVPETEPKKETEPESESESEMETETEDESELETETESEKESEKETEAESESEMEGETDFEIETERETDRESEPESERETEQESEPEAVTEAGSEEETDQKTETESESESECESETKGEAETEGATDAETESETESDPSSASTDGTPKTGDPSRPLFWFTLALAALGLMGANLSGSIKQKRRQRDL